MATLVPEVDADEYEEVEVEVEVTDDGEDGAEVEQHAVQQQHPAASSAASAGPEPTAQPTPAPAEPAPQQPQQQQQHAPEGQQAAAPVDQPVAAAGAAAAQQEAGGKLTQGQEEQVELSSLTASAGITGEIEFAQIEEKAAQVAKEVQQVASRLASGLKSALASAPSAPDAAAPAAAAAAAGATLGAIGSSISSWWANIDKTMAGEEPTAAAATQGRAPLDIGAQLRATFQLADDDVVVETFVCKLMQTYACVDNGLTAAMQMTLAGKLHISQQAACFEATEHFGASGKQLHFKVSYRDLVAASHEGARQGARRRDVLKLLVNPGSTHSGRCSGPGAEIASGAPAARSGGGGGGGGGSGAEGWSVYFQEFEGAGNLDSALALIHHLSESAA